jgi:hypothetical protein
MAVALLALCAVLAVAADISGKWVAQVPGRQGAAQETTFTFKVDGATLTGAVTNARGEQAITDGKVSGDAISFVTVMSFGGNEMKMLYKGTVAGSEIKFVREMQGGQGGRPPVEFVAKKAQ